MTTIEHIGWRTVIGGVICHYYWIKHNKLMHHALCGRLVDTSRFADKCTGPKCPICQKIMDTINMGDIHA